MNWRRRGIKMNINDDYLLAITVLSCIAIMVLVISIIETSIIYCVALYIFQFKIGKTLLIIIEIIAFIITGIITFFKINQC